MLIRLHPNFTFAKSFVVTTGTLLLTIGCGPRKYGESVSTSHEGIPAAYGGKTQGDSRYQEKSEQIEGHSSIFSGDLLSSRKINDLSKSSTSNEVQNGSKETSQKSHDSSAVKQESICCFNSPDDQAARVSALDTNASSSGSQGMSPVIDGPTSQTEDPPKDGEGDFASIPGEISGAFLTLACQMSPALTEQGFDTPVACKVNQSNGQKSVAQVGTSPVDWEITSQADPHRWVPLARETNVFIANHSEHWNTEFVVAKNGNSRKLRVKFFDASIGKPIYIESSPLNDSSKKSDFKIRGIGLLSQFVMLGSGEKVAKTCEDWYPKWNRFYTKNQLPLRKGIGMRVPLQVSKKSSVSMVLHGLCGIEGTGATLSISHQGSNKLVTKYVLDSSAVPQTGGPVRRTFGGILLDAGSYIIQLEANIWKSGTNSLNRDDFGIQSFNIISSGGSVTLSEASFYK